MVTINQIIRKVRKSKKKKNTFMNFPQIKGICEKVYTTKPKKPNSAIRKIARILLSDKRKVIGYIPGEGHNLQEHKPVLVRGGRRKDLPGVKFTLIRGKYDLLGVQGRKKGRSKYGTKINK